jgi:hypothetical protein
VAGIAWENQIAQRDDEIARLGVDLFERLQAKVVTVVLETDPIEFQRCLRSGVGREQGAKKAEDDGEA